MAYVLGIGDMLDALDQCDHPEARAFIVEAEQLANRMAAAICSAVDGVSCSAAKYDMGSVHAVFSPVDGTPLPDLLEGYDTPSEWGA
jgi:hypothetical protein